MGRWSSKAALSPVLLAGVCVLTACTASVPDSAVPRSSKVQRHVERTIIKVRGLESVISTETTVKSYPHVKE